MVMAETFATTRSQIVTPTGATSCESNNPYGGEAKGEEEASKP